MADFVQGEEREPGLNGAMALMEPGWLSVRVRDRLDVVCTHDLIRSSVLISSTSLVPACFVCLLLFLLLFCSHLLGRKLVE